MSAIVLLSLRSSGPSSIRGIFQPSCWLRRESQAKSTRSQTNASASVASASGMPPRRSAGSVTRAPRSIANATPAIPANRNGTPEFSSKPVISPAPVTNAAWPRLGMFPIPTMIVNDKKTKPSARPFTMSPSQKLSASTAR